MKVSIITVCFNSAKTIEETIESVNNQTYEDIEHIFIDGISNDNTLEIINSKSKRHSLVISEKDNGIYDAMNKGIKASSGEIIFILNSDDILFSNDIVTSIVRLFEANTSVKLIYGGIEFSTENDINKRIRRWEISEYRKDSFKKGWHPPHPGFVVKKEVYQTYGDFDINLKVAADFDVMLRFLEVYKIRALRYNKAIAVLRYGGNSTNIRGIILGMKDILRSFAKYNISISYGYFAKRYFNKLYQFINQ